MAATLLLTLPILTARAPDAAALAPSDVVVTDEVFAPSTSSSCAGQSATSATGIALRTAVDAQDDPWISTAASMGDTTVIELNPPTPLINPNQVDVHPTPIIVPGGNLTVSVSKHDVTAAQRDSLAPNSWGSLDAASNTDPYTPAWATSASASTLQDCSPRPQSLYDAVAQPQPRMWNATSGDGSTFDTAFFEFSRPVAAFGAWFGDVETRTDGFGVPAKLKLFDINGNVLYSSDLPTSTADQSNNCGGPLIGSDQVGCGNQGTRWIGFSTATAEVASMAVIVGDDDACDGSGQPNTVQTSQCNGFSEHVSWVGAKVALAPAEVTIDKVLAEGAGPHPIGTDITFEINVTNDGDLEATTVEVTDTLPDGLDVTSISAAGWTCTEIDGTVTCDLDTTLAPAAMAPTIEITTTVTADAGLGTLTNTASVTHVIDDQTLTATDDADLEREPSADLEVRKLLVADPGPDGKATWLIAVENFGSDSATDVTVTDTLPVGSTIDSVTAPGWTCTEGAAVTCALDDDLDPGDTALIVIATTAAGPGPIANSASVESSTPDPVPENNTTEATGEVPATTTTTTEAPITTVPPVTITSTTGTPSTVTSSTVVSTTMAPTTVPSPTSTTAGSASATTSGSTAIDSRSAANVPAQLPAATPIAAPTPIAAALAATGSSPSQAITLASVASLAGLVALAARRRRRIN